MLLILTISLALIFFLLAILHFYWALGGHWGFDQALPTNEKGEKILNPGKIDCSIVGIGLSLFGLFYLFPFTNIEFPEWIFQIGKWLIPSIFILRSIGDFKYIGLFKKLKNTPFGVKDTQIYVPICLAIGVIGLLIAL